MPEYNPRSSRTHVEDIEVLEPDLMVDHSPGTAGVSGEALIYEDDSEALMAVPHDPGRHREGGGLLAAGEALLQEQEGRGFGFGMVRVLDANNLDTKEALMRQLTANLPLNEINLPEYVFRPDLVDHAYIRNQLQSEAPRSVIAVTVQGMLDAATVKLDYDEGFPVGPEGKPFWHKLTWEPQNAYTAFTEYLGQFGARSVSAIASEDPVTVRSWAALYNWTIRAKAFDLYKVAFHQRQRLQRMMQAEDSHYRMAENLLAKIKPYFDNIPQEDINELGLEKLVNIADKLVKIQRISAGLTANGGDSDGKTPQKVQSVSVIMQNASPEEANARRNTEIDILRDDPDSVDLAQELIIRMQQGTEE